MDGWRQWGGGLPVVGLLCLAGVITGGCGVSQSRYDAAVADMQSARNNLEHSRLAREALEQENEILRSENAQVARDLEVMGAEIQRIKESRDHERALLDAQETELAKIRDARARTLLELRREHRRLKGRNRTLRETVRRYQNELKDARESPAVTPPSHNGASSTESMIGENVEPHSASAPPPLNDSDSVKLVNVNTASMNDLVVLLGLLEPMAERVIANRPYRLRGELLAKQVLPLETFHVIKDSITAAPR